MIESQWSGDGPLIDPLLFERLGKSEVVLRIEHRVAEGEVQRAMNLRSARLGDDLDPALARAVGLRTIGIAIDMRLGDRVGRNPRALHLDPVDDDADSAGRNPGLVE